MDPSSQRPENKVPGCLSTVFIDGTCTKDDALGKDGVYRIQFVGDSDGLLTKGLVALLVRGLSGNTAADIQLVDPAFIQQAGIATSLTPGRNNGFLNMLAVIKRKALELEAAAKEADQHSSSMLPNTAQQPDAVEAASASQINNPNPKYAAMIAALQKLEPTVLDLQDVSYQHAGHMEAGNGSETHFELDIVSDAFDGLNLIKRHKLVYSTLGDIMPQIHALQIRAKTSAES
jgi:sulfur transfer protein SufE/stress-induced morphogen